MLARPSLPTLTLIVGIIVALLRVHEFVASDKHRGSVGKHENGKEVLDLSFAKRHDVIRHTVVSFMTAVPAPVVVASIFIVVSVGPIMLVVVSDEIVQTKPVVSSDKVDRLSRPVTVSVREKIFGSIDSCHHCRNHAIVALDELADVVAVNTVPLPPSRSRKCRPELVRRNIPRFSNKPHIIVVTEVGNFRNQRRVLDIHASMAITSQNGSQVETEAVDMGVASEMEERFHNHDTNTRISSANGVATASIVHVSPTIVVFEEVVSVSGSVWRRQTVCI